MSLFYRGLLPYYYFNQAGDGQPATVWDGVTLGPDGLTPSKSSTAQINVVGLGTRFPIGFTLAEFCKLYYRTKWDEVNIDSDVVISNPSALATSPTSLTAFDPAEGSSTYYAYLGGMSNFSNPRALVAGANSGVSMGWRDQFAAYYGFDFGYVGIAQTDNPPFVEGSAGTLVGPVGWWSGVTANFILNLGFEGLYMVPGSDGDPDLYYPALNITVTGSSYCSPDGLDSYTPPSNPGLSVVTASANYSAAQIEAFKSDGTYGSGGGSNTSILFTLEDGEGNKILDEFELPGMTVQEGDPTATGTFVTLTVPNAWDYS